MTLPLRQIRKLNSYRVMILALRISLLFALCGLLAFVGVFLGLELAIAVFACVGLAVAAYFVSLVFQARLLPQLPQELGELESSNEHSFLRRPPPDFERQVREDLIPARFRS